MAPDGSFVLTRLQGARTNGRSYNRNRRLNWASTARQTSFDSVRSSFWPFSSAVAPPVLESRYQPERSGRYEYDSRQRADRRKRWVLPSLRNDHPSKWVFRNRVAAVSYFPVSTFADVPADGVLCVFCSDPERSHSPAMPCPLGHLRHPLTCLHPRPGPVLPNRPPVQLQSHRRAAPTSRFGPI